MIPLNGHRNTYVVLYYPDHYHPEAHFKSTRCRFKSLTDARKYVLRHPSGYIFKCHYTTDAEWEITPVKDMPLDSLRYQ